MHMSAAVLALRRASVARSVNVRLSSSNFKTRKILGGQHRQPERRLQL
jgi:hypothetical protein